MQNFFGTLTNPSLPLLDSNFSDLYNLREKISTVDYAGSAAAMKIASSRDLVVNGTISPATLANRGTLTVNGQSGGSAVITLSVSDASLGYFYSDSTDTDIGTSTASRLSFAIAGARKIELDASGNIRPSVDGGVNNGAASRRWNTVYAQTGTINTSDAREKSDISGLTPAEIKAASLLASEIGTYQWLTALASKGPSARLHVGITVQRVMEILASQGLDPMRYGFICYDQWPDQKIPERVEYRDTGLKDARGDPMYETTVIEPEKVIPAGDRYSFRPDELLFFIARGMEARLAALEAAIAP